MTRLKYRSVNESYSTDSHFAESYSADFSPIDRCRINLAARKSKLDQFCSTDTDEIACVDERLPSACTVFQVTRNT